MVDVGNDTKVSIHRKTDQKSKIRDQKVKKEKGKREIKYSLG